MLVAGKVTNLIQLGSDPLEYMRKGLEESE
jgi:hypothetical protein